MIFSCRPLSGGLPDANMSRFIIINCVKIPLIFFFRIVVHILFSLYFQFHAADSSLVSTKESLVSQEDFMVPSHTVSLEMGPDTKSTSLKETEVPRYICHLIRQNIERVCLAGEIFQNQNKLSRHWHMRFWYLSHMQPVKAQNTEIP